MSPMQFINSRPSMHSLHSRNSLMGLSRILLAITTAISLSSCQPDEPGKSPDHGRKQGGVAQPFGMIMGIVKDSQGQLLNEVEITSQGVTTRSNNQGYFVLSNLPENERMVVSFEKAGFVMTSDVTRVRIGESSYLEAVMKREEHQQSLQASAGGTAEIAGTGAAVKIPSNALVDQAGRPYTGTVNISMTPFDPTTPEGLAAFPGEFKGLNRNGEIVPIESYGYMDITPRSSDGSLLQLAPGSLAEIAIPIAPSLINRAPETMPLWYYNKTEGQWHEEGTMVRDGNVYRAKVSHFSIWNCDVALDRSYVIGRVIDCANTGLPVKGARVTIQGQRGWTSGESSTPDDGTFRIPVDSNHNCTIWASKNGVNSAKKSFLSAGSDGVINIGDLCLGTPKIKIALTWDIEPNDLDAHLTCPLASGSRDHVFFGHKQGQESSLDTDDTSGFGPEIISVYKLRDGKYRYSTQHFAGRGTISSSKATVTMMIEGVGIYQMSAPPGAKGVGDLWQLWDISVQDGRVIKVDPLQVIKTPTGTLGEKDYNP